VQFSSHEVTTKQMSVDMYDYYTVRLQQLSITVDVVNEFRTDYDFQQETTRI